MSKIPPKAPPPTTAPVAAKAGPEPAPAPKAAEPVAAPAMVPIARAYLAHAVQVPGLGGRYDYLAVGDAKFPGMELLYDPTTQFLRVQRVVDGALRTMLVHVSQTTMEPV